MMTDSLFANYSDASLELQVGFLHPVGVFRDRNHLIRLANHMKKRNFGLSEAFKPIKRETLEACRLLFGEPVGV